MLNDSELKLIKGILIDWTHQEHEVLRKPHNYQMTQEEVDLHQERLDRVEALLSSKLSLPIAPGQVWKNGDRYLLVLQPIPAGEYMPDIKGFGYVDLKNNHYYTNGLTQCAVAAQSWGAPLELVANSLEEFYEQQR